VTKESLLIAAKAFALLIESTFMQIKMKAKKTFFGFGISEGMRFFSQM
jgi:hypothetical protein